MLISAGLGVPELSKFPAGSAGLALEPQQTARVKVTARAAADLLRPGTPNSAEIDTHVSNCDTFISRVLQRSITILHFLTTEKLL